MRPAALVPHPATGSTGYLEDAGVSPALLSYPSGPAGVMPAAWLQRGSSPVPWWSRMYSWRKDNG